MQINGAQGQIEDEALHFETLKTDVAQKRIFTSRRKPIAALKVDS
ncbi:hypothetical protein [Bradyrhizobium sacchari]|uniref:Uncharacterized protein n=1 Tax=Bradyrhizobium sacchari TaxID=1399419 RepID=A0A560HVP9_9BRAD|nr:hypothetical protein [Bradyrhizobium sacchari]TWB50698.1 hypothetical protein FBZ94_11128 [Bradyrhizobium sacchari]TWB69094.1 hypothetical protein FBZ95_110216 [Bradyrhizobium sacchari]